MRKWSEFSAALIAISFFAPSVQAVVVYDSGAWPYSSAAPSSAFFGKFNDNASAVAVAGDVIITTAHQGGGVGSAVVFGSTTYNVVQQLSTFAPNIDLRVYRVQNQDGSTPNLSHTTIYNGTDGVSFVNAGGGSKPFTAIGGFGATVGTALANGSGYNIVNNSPINNGPLTIGANLIEGVGAIGAGDTYTGTTVLVATFEAPSTTQAPTDKVAQEATVGLGDSGGGWFVLTSSGWQLAGVTHGVEHIDNALFGEQLNATYLSAYYPQLAAIVPEPASLGGAALLTLVALRRRRLAAV